LEPVSNHIDELFSATLEKHRLPPKTFKQIRHNYLVENNLEENDVAFVPFEGKYGYSLLVFDKTGIAIDSIPDPRYGDYSSFFFK
ncbi:MAG: hypothetical protein GTO02_21195, partial [Candidatus Dadabacteria bacterium]|nr:hypothetical protein [Candidatus Dadabacteria bacterium]